MKQALAILFLVLAGCATAENGYHICGDPSLRKAAQVNPTCSSGYHPECSQWIYEVDCNVKEW